MNLFEVFGLKPTVELSAEALEKQYRELSLKLHPDRVGTAADAKARRVALEQTTALNEAYRTLKDPVKRAFYLLTLEGVDLGKEDAGAQKDMPLEFLEEVMELREQLEGLKSVNDLIGAQAMAGDVQARSEDALKEATSALKSRLAGGGQENVPRAAHALARVRYFTRFLEEVEQMEEEALQ